MVRLVESTPSPPILETGLRYEANLAYINPIALEGARYLLCSPLQAQ